jgi:Flp pilus assembly protein TadG
MRNLFRRFARFARNRAGNVAIIAALALPVMVGFFGLGGETAYWYFRDRDLQGAADVAAYNGALALRGGATSSAITTGATTDAQTNGWSPANGTIVVNTPPTSGTHQNNSSVEVILTESDRRYFTGLFVAGNIQIRTRAVAQFNALGTSCVLALDKNKAGAVIFWGNSTSSFTDCNVLSDSISPTGFQVGGSATATMPCAMSAGGFSATGGLTLTTCPKPISNGPEAPDPYATLPAPTVPVGCTGGNGDTPGHYCGGLTYSGNHTLAPGVYIVDGGTLKINANANLTGAGITFYLTNGATVQMNGNAQVNLSAPTTGTYAGILFYGDRTQPYAIQKINGNASSMMTGAIYFPSQEVDFLGNFSGANGCLQVVADTISYSGNSHFSSNCSAYGMKNVSDPGAIAMVE